MADAPPPPLQMPATPMRPATLDFLPFSLARTLRSVTTIRAAEAPNGWPSETAPADKTEAVRDGKEMSHDLTPLVDTGERKKNTQLKTHLRRR